MVDRTLVNIASLELGAIGLAVVFLDYGARELNASFWGSNLYAVKRDAIANKRDRAFLFMAATSVLLQIGVEIWGAGLAERLYSSTQYLVLTLVFSVFLAATSSVMWVMVKKLARRQWEPEVIDEYREAYEKTCYLVEHEYLSESHERERHKWPPGELERVQKMNREQFTSIISHIERLLETPSQGDLAARVARLSPYFAHKARSG